MWCKTKALISCEVTVQVIWALVFTYAKSRFSHEVAHLEKVSLESLVLRPNLTLEAQGINKILTHDYGYLTI